MTEMSSISLERSKINNVEHVTRRISPTYLLKNKSLGVECSLSTQEASRLLFSLEDEAIRNYTERTGQKLQSKNYKWSAVVNIKETTTMNDLKKLTGYLYEKYGWQCYLIGIHRDEGYLDPDTNQVKYNLHAHLEFLMLNKKGIYCFKKGEWGKGRMSRLQSEVANILGMKRGESLADRITKLAKLLNVDASSIQRQNGEKYALYCKRLDHLAEEKGIADFNAASFLKGKRRLDHYQYRAVQRQKDEIKKDILHTAAECLQEAVNIQTDKVLKDFTTKSVVPLQKELKEKDETISNLRSEKSQLKEQNLSLKEQKAQIEAERKKYKEEGEHQAEEYRKLQALNKALHTQEELDCALAKLRKEYEDRLSSKETDIKQLKEDQQTLNTQLTQKNNTITSLQQSLNEKPKERIIEKRVEVPVEKIVYKDKIVFQDKIIRRDLTTDEIELLPRVQTLKETVNKLKDDKSKLENDLKAAKLETKTVFVEKPVPRNYTNEEIEKLQRVEELKQENQNLKTALQSTKSMLSAVKDELSSIYNFVKTFVPTFDLQAENRLNKLKIWITGLVSHKSEVKQTPVPVQREEPVEQKQTESSSWFSSFFDSSTSKEDDVESESNEKIYSIDGFGELTAQQIRDNLSTEPNDGGFELKELRDKLGDDFYEVFPEEKKHNSDRMQILQRKSFRL